MLSRKAKHIGFGEIRKLAVAPAPERPGPSGRDTGPAIQTFGGKPIEAWRRRPAQLTAAVNPEVAIVGVVGKNEEDIRLLRLLTRSSRPTKRSPPSGSGELQPGSGHGRAQEDTVRRRAIDQKRCSLPRGAPEPVARMLAGDAGAPRSGRLHTTTRNHQAICRPACRAARAAHAFEKFTVSSCSEAAPSQRSN
jgi:hypothetical protein